MRVLTPRQQAEVLHLLPEISTTPCATLARRGNFASRRRIVRAQTGRFPEVGLLQQRTQLVFDVVEACMA